MEYQWDQIMMRQDELLFADDDDMDELIQEKLFARKKFKEPLFEEA